MMRRSVDANMDTNVTGNDVIVPTDGRNVSEDAVGVLGDVYVEDYSMGIKVCFAITGMVTLITGGVAFTAMSRTRKIPRAAKFLAMCLLLFDSGFIILSTVRKFTLSPVVNLLLMVLGTICLQHSYVTVGLMTFERYLVLCRPNFYLRNCSLRHVKIAAFLIWTLCTCTFLFLRYGVCFLQHGELAFYLAGTCNMLVTVYYSFLVAVVLGTSFTCYNKIIATTRRIACSTQSSKANIFVVMFKNFKSTALVLVYFVVILVTSFAYIVILVFIRQFNLGISELRISLELVNIVNCFLDPYLYVLWFEETKMECLKILSPCSKRLKSKVEGMRGRIFDIVVSDAPQMTAKVAPHMTAKVAPIRY